MLPFLKWAGGKRWLFSSDPSLFIKKINRYIEPFLGGGAVFFHVKPFSALLADSNHELIETYQAIKDDWRRVVRELRKHHRLHDKKYYYRVRNTEFQRPYSRAAKFIYLNRTCWNGLYRVNLSGSFNVPIGTKNEVYYDTDDFEGVARLLQRAQLTCSDFEPVIDQAVSGDLIFADPPYTVKHNNNNFVKYNENIFSWQDQQRLSKCLINAANRGALVVLTNANHLSIRSLYSYHFDLKVLERSSVIASNPEHRGIYEELLIRSKL